MTDFRVYCQGWFQVPVVYGWHDLVCHGEAVRHAPAPLAPANGH
jgi:hypothetical protein